MIAAIAAAAAAAMAFAGCSDADAGRQAPAPHRRPWSDDDVQKPAWIADPTRDGTIIAAWGSTPSDAVAGRGAMRDRALDSARRELARMVMVKVEAVLKDYVAESGAGVTSFAESVSRTVAVQSVKASYQRDEWIHPKTGELFIWAVADPSFGERLARTVGETAARDPALDAHARAKLGADQGFAELDRLLDRSFSGDAR
ncbi:MAG: hypothetical protein J0M02_17230 [Planctomycetes bacterium]|nr:hypothetical protein [Planctomycetota bacterium]